MQPDQRSMRGAAPSMLDTLPKAVTAGISAFCRTLADSDPVFVRCHSDATPSRRNASTT